MKRKEKTGIDHVVMTNVEQIRQFYRELNGIRKTIMISRTFRP